MRVSRVLLTIAFTTGTCFAFAPQAEVRCAIDNEVMNPSGQVRMVEGVRQCEYEHMIEDQGARKSRGSQTPKHTAWIRCG